MRRIATIIILLFAARALLAADESPRFFIERIDVRNTRHASPAIIRAETRLQEGRDYTEADLRDASDRVARLPFVLDAQYSLEKGSRRDAYVFVIAVTETRPFFYDVDLRPYFGDIYGDETGDLVIGGRMFAGSRGVFHAAVGSMNIGERDRDLANFNGGDIRTLQAGYTQYDILGSRAFASISIARQFGFPTGGTSPTVAVVAGIPLTPNQTVSLTAGRSDAVTGWFRTNGRKIPRDAVSDLELVSWSYNTTNSPFRPTRGELLTLGAQRTRNDVRRGYGSDPDGHSHTNATLFVASYEKYWELSEKNSIALLGRAELGRESFDYHYILLSNVYDGRGTRRSDFESAIVNLSHSFFDSRKARSVGDSWVDLGIGLRHRRDPFHYIGRDDQIHTGPVASASWSRRTSWGRVRLGAVYSW